MSQPAGHGAGSGQSPSPWTRLAQVEMQLVMHCCNPRDLVSLARCNRSILAAASQPLAWRQHRALQLRLTDPTARLVDDDRDVAPSTSTASFNLLRHVDLSVVWTLQRFFMRPSDAAALASLPRIRHLTIERTFNSEKQYLLEDSCAKMLFDALSAPMDTEASGGGGEGGGAALQTLLLRNHLIGAKGTAALVTLISRSRTLAHLDLRGNHKIAYDAMRDLALAVTHCPTLRILNLDGCRVARASDAQAISQALASDQCGLEELDLSNCYMQAAQIDALVPGVQQNSTLKWLRLNHNDLQDAGATSLSRALVGHRSLTAIELRQCSIHEAGVVALAESLEKCNTMRSVDLTWARFGAVGAAALAEVLRSDSCALVALTLNSCRMGEVGVETLTAGLQSNRSLTELRADDCFIDPAGRVALAAALNCHSNSDPGDDYAVRIRRVKGAAGAATLAHALRCGINIDFERLDLSGCSLGDEGAAALALGLNCAQSLRRLDLGHNSVGAEGCEALARSLHGHASLAEFSFASNACGDQGLAALAPSLRSCSRMTELDFSSCGLGPTDSAVLAQWLQHSGSSLRSLYLGNNRLGDEGAATLAAALRSASSLLRLRLSANGLGAEGAAALAESIRDGWSPSELDLGGNGSIGDEGALALAAAIQRRASALRMQSLALPVSLAARGVATWSLRSLSLSLCGLTDASVLALLHSLASVCDVIGSFCLDLHDLDLSGAVGDLERMRAAAQSAKLHALRV